MTQPLDRLLYQGLRHVPRSRPFVFGVGLSKTGTTSLNDALGMLGYRAFHLPPVADAPGGRIRFRPEWWAYKYDAWTDISASLVFAELWRTFPNARFIYTRRDMEGWLRSCERHFTLELVEDRIRQGNIWILELCLACYGTLLFDRDRYRAAYAAHEAAVLDLMGGSDRFLDLDIIGGEGWDKLCAFLDRPVPDAPFPLSNKQRPDR
jgi:hypothetical protein